MSMNYLPPEAIDYIKVTSPKQAWTRTMQPHPSQPVKCPACNDGGWITLHTTASEGLTSFPSVYSVSKHAVEYFDGKYYLCTRETYPCHMCNAGGLIIDKYWDDSGLQLAERDWNLDYYAKLSKEIPVMSLEDWLTQKKRPTGIKILYGGYGMGKSGMGKSMVGGFIRAGARSHYTTAEDFLSLCRSTFKEEGFTETMIFSQYAGYRFLVLDEVDPERITNSSYGQASLFRLINKRYDARASLATLIISNQNPDDLWPYLASRMEDAERIMVSGQPLRGRAEPSLFP